jgi:hypothetical protein
MLRSVGAIVAAVGVIATLATLKPAEGRDASGCGQQYGYPANYYDLPTYYYGGFYSPRVVLAPCVYGSFVRYRTVRRYW